MLKKVLAVIVAAYLLLAGLLSCGLEEIYYIQYVPESDINMIMTNTATIMLPGSGSEGYSYFTNFVIFYRIYITTANNDAQVTVDTQRINISTQLQSDFSALAPVTSTTSTTVNTSIGTTFSNRNYYMLELEGASLDALLGSGALSGTVEIYFSANNGEYPTLKLNGGTAYRLFRSNTLNNGGSFSPEPTNRFFLNAPQLCDSSKVNNQVNADVAQIDSTHSTASNSGSPRTTYVSMYIAAMGKDYLTTFYSIPTFIGIFKLPEQ